MHYPTFSLKPPTDYLIGHRGLSSQAPENTLASFTLAASQGVEWVEFDLRLTKDDELIVFHDDTLERTTNGQGFVHEHTLAELKDLDAGMWFNERYQNEKIPAFKELLPALICFDLQLNIELKLPANATANQAKTLAQKLLTLVQSHWPANRPLPLVSSFHWELLAIVREFAPAIPLGFLQEECTSALLQVVASTPNSAVHCHYQSLTAAAFKQSREWGIPLLAYTVNNPVEASALFKHGVFALFSDDPLPLRNL